MFGLSYSNVKNEEVKNATATTWNFNQSPSPNIKCIHALSTNFDNIRYNICNLCHFNHSILQNNCYLNQNKCRTFPISFFSSSVKSSFMVWHCRGHSPPRSKLDKIKYQAVLSGQKYAKKTIGLSSNLPPATWKTLKVGPAENQRGDPWMTNYFVNIGS